MLATIGDLAQELLGQRQDVVLRAEDATHGDTTGDLLEVGKLHLQRQRTTLKLSFLQTTEQFDHGVIEFDGDL